MLPRQVHFGGARTGHWIMTPDDSEVGGFVLGSSVASKNQIQIAGSAMLRATILYWIAMWVDSRHTPDAKRRQCCCQVVSIGVRGSGSIVVGRGGFGGWSVHVPGMAVLVISE